MTTCAKCGTENLAGDAFCGGCGAFLEFAAEEAAEEAQAGEGAPAEATAGEPVSPATLPPPPPPLAAPAPAPAGTMPAGAAPAPVAPSGPTCSACGRLNPVGRRFCISCGGHLPAASPSAVPGPGSPSSSAGSARPAWEFPTGQVPPAAAPAAAPSVRASSGGRSRLPLIGGAIVVLALFGGGAVLVLGGGLGGGTPGPSASAPPSGALASTSPGAGQSGEPTAPAETPAATEVPSITPELTTAPATIPPGPSVGIVITAATASSQQAANRAPKYLYDGSPLTAWKSATGKLDGSWVEVSFAATAVTKIQIWAGWQRGDAAFYGNHRPRNVTVAFDGGVPQPLELKDAFGAQGVPIPPELGIVGATRLRITIIDTYPSRKTSAAGSPSKEVAISEIRVFGVPTAP